MSRFNQLIHALSDYPQGGQLSGILRGLEKESLRVTPQGTLALTPHPAALGSPLTHPAITTDFSEALLEFITAPHRQASSTLAELEAIHQFVYSQLDNEYLWVNSMPCALPADAEIPVAQYGSANVAKMKTIYRLGLGHRYGRLMQTIAGIHYNFSLPDEFWQTLQTTEGSSLPLRDFKTQRYFDLIRNFRRYSWLLLYLYGAAPAVCPTFVQGRKHHLTPLDAHQRTLYSPYATSLRMGDLGYQSQAQQSLEVNYNNLPDYLRTLCGAITQHHPAYTRLGIKDGAGHYQQLNDGILQIENEFYSSIRPKRTTHSGETALHALMERGVEYIEVRCLDLNPFEPLGINRQQMQFIDSFLLFCLLQDSPASNAEENRQLQENQQRMVYRGRDPGLTLLDAGRERRFGAWAEALLTGISETAELLDGANDTHDFSQSVSNARALLTEPQLTPSGQVISHLKQQQQSYYEFGQERALATAQHFRAHPLAAARYNAFKQTAAQSLAEQATLEAQDREDFESYRAAFYRQYSHCKAQTE